MSGGSSTANPFGWWTSLTHGGLLIAPNRLPVHLKADLGRLSDWAAEALRRAVIAAVDDPRGDLTPLLDVVLEQVLKLKADGSGGGGEVAATATWLKGSSVGAEWSRPALTGEGIKPRRIWQGPNGAVLPVFTADGALMGGRGERAGRLGIGRGRRPVSRVVGWLRQAELPVAVLTNGRQWRLIHAGDDYDAWCEWDIELWFEEGRPGPQVTALRVLLGPDALTPPTPDAPSPLVAAITASRRGQAELSKDLGERVRQAVELLIGAFGGQLDALDAQRGGDAARQSLYIAATRLIMRLVVALFAEARGDDLLPRANAIYHDSYSLQGLREQLDRQRPDRLRHQRGAWPRLMALFGLIHAGSPHPDLLLRAYGGDLFRPGDAAADDPVLRALAALENPAAGPNDDAVRRVLALLTRSRVRVAQGRGAVWVEAPVDFSDLSTEYIGILYEGLLDFELRRAPVDDAVVFLALGDQPALPLARLEQMDDGAIKQLLEKAKKSAKRAVAGGDDDEAEADDDAEGEDEVDADVDAGDDVDVDVEADADGADEPSEPEGADVDDTMDAAAETNARVARWAERAVVAGGLVRRSRGAQTAARAAEQARAVERASRELTARIVQPGEWFLVRWGGTRKGAGTFYTRPQLAGPTAVRTLRPLAYDAVSEATDAETGLTTVTEWAPKPPEAILALKVCDPAMGSGSFLVASLRFLTGALLESLYHHDRLAPRGDGTVVRLADGRPADDPSNELLPVPPDHPEFEDRLRARLKRHVVERCLYGVDIDPLAVELARLALWIETMDRSLPFGFLDHKLQVGNALVGGWLDQVADYPIQAWQRDGGDSTHERFAHHFRDHVSDRGKDKGKVTRKGDKWTHAIKDVRESVVRPALVRWINAARPGAMSFIREDQTVEAVHDAAVRELDAIHNLPVHETDQRQARYQALLADPTVRGLRDALDTWCALWFWPGDQLHLAPTAEDFQAPGEASLEIVRSLAAEHGFFHWELAFPEVFTGAGGGFDAVVGNPPWETLQPNSKEFFSNHDPLYRTYGKQDALRRQAEWFKADAGFEHEWLEFNAYFAAMSNWLRFVASPWGDPEAGVGSAFSLSRKSSENTLMHRAWRQRRASRHGFADPAHPFRHQGQGKAYTYKMFLEQSFALLRTSGRLGLIIPSGLYTDSGSVALRSLFLDRGSWEWLFGFENRDGIFDIHRSFKFCPVIVQKGGRTAVVRTAFMRRDLDDWRDAERWAVAYPRDRVTEFSPKSRAILEIRGPRDLAILHKLYANGVLLGDDGPDGWGVRYRQGDFNMTSDSKLFPPRPKWEADGYRGDEYGHWLKGPWRPWDGPTGVASILTRPEGVVLSQDGRWAMDVGGVEGVALPLYQGVMIWGFDHSAKGYPDTASMNAKWLASTGFPRAIAPKYLMNATTFSQVAIRRVDRRVGFRDLTNSTNQRTMIASLVPHFPCGNKVPVLTLREPRHSLGLTGCANAFVFDYGLRARFAVSAGAGSLNPFILFQLALPMMPVASEMAAIEAQVARLGRTSAAFALSILRDSEHLPAIDKWACTSHERIRLRSSLDAIVAEIFGLNWEDLAHILHDCDHPVADSTSKVFTRYLDPKGFWRVDKDQDPELRHTVLSLIAFADLKAAIAAAGGDREAGIAAFCGQNDGDGWMLPEEVRLADYGLGHDARARVKQAVRGRMGERFLPWQLAMSGEESWEACRRHAELIGRIVPWAAGGYVEDEGGAGLARAAEGVGEYGGKKGQMPLF